nr:DJ-1/PfpI family protein [Burkholderia ubonensis]
MHTVAVLALPDVVPFDLGVACDTFARVRSPNVEHAYRVRVCSEQPRVAGDLFELRPAFRLDALADADTIIVPGTSVPLAPTSRRVIAALRAAAARGCRIASICSGAFVLAEAGLLDGLRATTHWLAAGELARRYPRVTVDPNVLFVDNGQILTSAGAAATAATAATAVAAKAVATAAKAATAAAITRSTRKARSTTPATSCRTTASCTAASRSRTPTGVRWLPGPTSRARAPHGTRRGRCTRNKPTSGRAAAGMKPASHASGIR